MRFIKFAWIYLFIVLIYGCANIGLTKTPAQAFYVAESQYVVLSKAAADYAESPTANKEIVRKIKDIDARAYGFIRNAQSYPEAYQVSTDMIESYINTMKSILREVK